MPDLNIEDSFTYEGYEFSIHEIDGHQIQYLDIKKVPVKVKEIIEE